jgi:hypothetical protein
VSRASLFHVLMLISLNSLPVALQYEKFHIPDSIRVLDAMIETLQY